MTDSAQDRRRRHERRGHRGEWLAALALMLKGYRVVARRYRTKLGEIDLIARRGRTLVFVEVKARGDLETAIEAVTPRARARILAAADAFVARHPAYADHDRRFDIVAVLPRRWPRHHPDAFRADDGDLPRFRPR